MEALIREQGLEHQRRVEHLESSLKQLTQKLGANGLARTIGTSHASAIASTGKSNVHTLQSVSDSTPLPTPFGVAQSYRPISRSPTATMTVTSASDSGRVTSADLTCKIICA